VLSSLLRGFTYESRWKVELVLDSGCVGVLAICCACGAEVRKTVCEMAAALAAAVAAASSTAANCAVRLSTASNGGIGSGRASSAFVASSGSQIGSQSSSLTGTGVACMSLSNARSSRSRSLKKAVVSPRAVSDSSTTGDSVLDPDASRVSVPQLSLWSN
jgi:hypothetical protein